MSPETPAPPLRAFAICPVCCELFPSARSCPRCQGVVEAAPAPAPEPERAPVEAPPPAPIPAPAAPPRAQRSWTAALSVAVVVVGALAFSLLSRL